MKDRAVVVGMGYVGIPLACTIAKGGADVIGIDLNKERVRSINRGAYPLKGDEPNLPELLRKVVKEKSLKATDDFSACKGADAVFVCIDTPIDEKKKPIFDHILAAAKSIGENLSPGVLVVIESTVAPGTTLGKILPILEKKSGLKAGKNLFIAHCPERVMAGKLLYNLTNLDRVFGGYDEKTIGLGLKWYSKITCGKIHTTGVTTAEAVKTTENAYRDVQIAFANEIGLICEKLGIDAFEVRKLVNSCPYRDMHLPGAGVGGHCLPKDTWLIAYGGKEAKPKLLPAARNTNDFMPIHVAELVDEVLAGSKRKGGARMCVAIFGLSFLENSGDTRNSPSKDLIGELKGKYDIVGHDPYVDDFEGIRIEKEIDETLSDADCAVFMTRHKEYTLLALEHIMKAMKGKALVDGRNIFDKKAAEKLGLKYRGIGKG